MLPSPSSPTPSRANARMGARTTPRGTLGTAGAAQSERLQRFPGPPTLPTAQRESTRPASALLDDMQSQEHHSRRC